MSKFQINEIAILQNCKHPQHNGIECEIIEILGGEYYWVELSYNPIKKQLWRPRPGQLRKKKPPKENIDWVKKLKLKSPKTLVRST